MTTLSAHLSRPVRRLAYAGIFAVLLAAAIGLVVASDASWPWLAATMMAPDLALLAGVGRGLAPGQLHPRAVPLYNALHRPEGPVVLGAAAAALLSPALAVVALSWGAHIACDRAVGYGLRSPDGHQRP